jgi:hypothetical protein
LNHHLFANSTIKTALALSVCWFYKGRLSRSIYKRFLFYFDK